MEELSFMSLVLEWAGISGVASEKPFTPGILRYTAPTAEDFRTRRFLDGRANAI